MRNYDTDYDPGQHIEWGVLWMRNDCYPRPRGTIGDNLTSLRSFEKSIRKQITIELKWKIKQ